MPCTEFAWNTACPFICMLSAVTVVLWWLSWFLQSPSQWAELEMFAVWRFMYYLEWVGVYAKRSAGRGALQWGLGEGRRANR